MAGADNALAGRHELPSDRTGYGVDPVIGPLAWCVIRWVLVEALPSPSVTEPGKAVAVQAYRTLTSVSDNSL